MDEIPRFCSHWYGVVLSDNGDYVKYVDYASKIRHLEKKVSARDRLIKAMVELETRISSYRKSSVDFSYNRERLQKLREAVDAVKAAHKTMGR